MEYKKRLSICMMVKNEEKYLNKSLESLKAFSDNFPTEIIVVDTGSEDRTVEIAKKHTDKVYYHKWNNDFGGMRNKTIEYAEGEWLLILDGDEVFEKPGPLIEFLKSSISSQYNTGSISIRNITREKEEEIYQQKGDILRLFRNTKDFKYKGAIHEQPIFKNPVFFSDAEVAHYGYLSTDPELMEYKFRRNVELLEKELEKEPDHIYNLFQLSQSYGMYGKYKKSLEFILKAYELIKKDKKNQKHYLHIYNQLARAYYQNNKHKELEKICLEALRIERDYIDFYYYIGIAQSVLEKNKSAIRHFKQYLRLLEKGEIKKDARDLVLVKSTLGFRENVNLNLAILHNKIGDNDQALQYLEGISEENFGDQAIDLLVKSYMALKKYEGLLSEYNKILNAGERREKLIQEFWISLESSIGEETRKEQNKIMELFSQGDCNYSLLNRVRLHMQDHGLAINQSLIGRIRGLEFGDLPVFFGDLIYALLSIGVGGMGEILSKVKYPLLQAYIQYIINKHDDKIKEVAHRYLDRVNEKSNFRELRFQKELRKALLVNNLLNYKEYQEVFHDYIDEGIYYINSIYNKELIENENIYDIKNDEDIFLIYMEKARQVKKTDGLAYIGYLRKALRTYPAMKKGIELLIKEFEEIKDKKQMGNKEEFNELKMGVKENIKMFLDAEKIEEAKLIIDQYLQIVPDDLEMLMLKSEIYLKQTNK